MYELISISLNLIANSCTPAQFLLALIERKPDIYLDEMQTKLQEQHGIIVGLSTIWEALTELGLTRKKVRISSSFHLLYLSHPPPFTHL